MSKKIFLCYDEDFFYSHLKFYYLKALPKLINYKIKLRIYNYTEIYFVFDLSVTLLVL